MNITHYIPADFESRNELNTFTVELDGLTQEKYVQKCRSGLFKHSKAGLVISSRCQKCGHVVIDETVTACTECGSIRFTYKPTDEKWALEDSDGVPEQFIGKTDLLPSFWAFNAFLTDSHDVSQSVIDSLLADSASFEDIDDSVYQVQYLTDTEVNNEFSELLDNLFPDANQDWPADPSERSHGYSVFTPDYSRNEGYNF